LDAVDPGDAGAKARLHGSFLGGDITGKPPGLKSLVGLGASGDDRIDQKTLWNPRFSRTALGIGPEEALR
jgi:hypothetical protein